MRKELEDTLIGLALLIPGMDFLFIVALLCQSQGREPFIPLPV